VGLGSVALHRFHAKPGSAPTAVQEFCGRGVKEGSFGGDQEVMIALQDLSLAAAPGEPIEDRGRAEGSGVAERAQGGGGTGSDGGAGVPLSNGEDSVGVLALLHNKRESGRTPMPWC